MLRTITPAVADPITLAEAKAHLRVDFTDDDDFIASLVKAATLHAQAITQRLFVEQTVEWILPDWPDAIRLPVAPVRATDGIVSIKYVDVNDAQQTLATSNYIVRQDGPGVCIFPPWGVTWPYLSLTPAAEPIVIRFIAGLPIDESPQLAVVPENVKAAIKLMVGHWYQAREQVVIDARSVVLPLPFGANELLSAEEWH